MASDKLRRWHRPPARSHHQLKANTPLDPRTHRWLCAHIDDGAGCEGTSAAADDITVVNGAATVSRRPTRAEDEPFSATAPSAGP
jgi:hypothetical protein